MVTIHPDFRPRSSGRRPQRTRLTDEAARRQATAGPVSLIERAIAAAGGQPLVVDDGVIQIAFPASREAATAVIEDGLFEVVLLMPAGVPSTLPPALPGSIALELRDLRVDARPARLLAATWAVADVLGGALGPGLAAYVALAEALQHAGGQPGQDSHR